MSPERPVPPHGGTTTVSDALRGAARRLREAGIDEAGGDARRLIAHACSFDAAALLRSLDHSLSTDQASTIEGLLARRLAREPISRIVGLRAFYGQDFALGPDTLDPRPDTETLVETVLELHQHGLIPGGNRPTILDLGTGTGAILLVLLLAIPEARGLGVDIARGAVDVARRNASALGLSGRVRLQTGNWYEAAPASYDVIVSNPPYIPSDVIDTLAPEVARYDPRTALDGGRDGLDAYRHIIRAAPGHLVPGGWLVVEVGAGQADCVIELMQEHGLGTGPGMSRCKRDLGGIVRSVAVRARLD